MPVKIFVHTSSVADPYYLIRIQIQDLKKIRYGILIRIQAKKDSEPGKSKENYKKNAKYELFVFII